MITNLVPEWLSPFALKFRKPKDWAAHLRPPLGGPSRDGDVPEELNSTITKAQNALLRQQNHEEGYWYSALRADTTLESDTIMLLNFLGRGQSIKVRKLANHLLNEQLADGGWP